MSLSYKPFEKALENMFVNGRGELSNNLNSSRSKVAEEVRQRRAREAKEKDLQKKIYKLNRDSHKVRLEIKEARNNVENNEKSKIALNIFVSERENIIKENNVFVNKLKGELRRLRRSGR